jgi:hypothetical protein
VRVLDAVAGLELGLGGRPPGQEGVFVRALDERARDLFRKRDGRRIVNDPNCMRSRFGRGTGACARPPT